ncbi:MAG: hypothetical protein L6R40_007399 [Gallowayella cf. fulva]|nr:MAG: hypothetical protein L6R40_007399 [Xanthomendoza cf. fulva]
MVGTSILAYCILLLTSLNLGLSNPLKATSAKSRFTISVNPTNTNQASNLPGFLFDFAQPPNPEPLTPAGATQCLTAALAEARTHRLVQPVPPEGLRINRDGVSLTAYPLSDEYTWGLLQMTIRIVRDKVEGEDGHGLFACNWEISRPSDDGRGRRRVYGRGRMWADRPSGGGGDNSSLSNPSANNASSKSVIATPYDDFEFDLKYDSPSRALDEVSANDALMICYAAASGHEMDQRFPRLGRRFGKDDVVVDIQPTDVGYTWGMFDYTDPGFYEL